MTATGPAKYRPRVEPVLEAWQVTDDNMAEVAAWCGGNVQPSLDDPGTTYVKVPNIQKFAAWCGWWVLRGTTGSFFVLADKAFTDFYEPVRDRPKHNATCRCIGAATIGHVQGPMAQAAEFQRRSGGPAAGGMLV